MLSEMILMKKLFFYFLLLFTLFAGSTFGAQPGDVNGDGSIDLTDTVMVIRLLSGDKTVDVTLEADINQDGMIGMQEAIYALQWVAGLRHGVLPSAPVNQFNIGDSIGEGEAADGFIRSFHHDAVWSTGYNTSDITYSINERFEDIDAEVYDENNSMMDATYNKAVSGATMSDFAGQAGLVVTEADLVGAAGMVTVFLCNNDVCAGSLETMTNPVQFEADYRAGLDILAASESTKNAEIHVSGIPDIYWLWVAKKNDMMCQFVWSFGNICQALLNNPDDDCASIASRDDPDVVYPGDGPNCQRRKEFHQKIRDIYNTILRDVLQEYVDSGKLPNAYFVDIFDIKFNASQVNDGDCFHPSVAGHKLLAEEEWCRSHWSDDDPLCAP